MKSKKKRNFQKPVSSRPQKTGSNKYNPITGTTLTNYNVKKR